MKTTIVNIDNLALKEIALVRKGTPDLFRNTFVVDGDIVHGYTRDGAHHVFDTPVADVASEFEWYVDHNGDVVTDDIPNKNHVRLAALVWVFFSFPPVWCQDSDGVIKRDWSMLDFVT